MNRDNRLDGIRCIAITLVIMVHTWSLARVDATTYPLLGRIYDSIVCMGVPLFLMLSGALQLSRPIESISSYYRKRFQRLLIPFFIWSGIVYILSSVVGKYEEISDAGDALRLYVPYLLENKINMAYWYVGLIAVLYILTPFLQKAIQGCGKKTLYMVIATWLVIVVLRHIYPNLFVLRYTSDLIYYLGFYISGYVLYTEQLHLSKVQTIWLGVCIAGSMALSIANVPSVILWRMVATILLFALLLQKDMPQRGYVRTISESSYTIYLSHVILISPLYQILKFNGSVAPLWQCSIIPLLSTLVVLAVCSIGCYMCKRWLPFYKYLGIE